MEWLIKETNELNRKSTNAKSPLIPFLSGLNYFTYPLITLQWYQVRAEIRMLSNRWNFSYQLSNDYPINSIVSRVPLDNCPTPSGEQ